MALGGTTKVDLIGRKDTSYAGCDYSETITVWERHDTVTLFMDGLDTLTETGEVAHVIKFSRMLDSLGFSRFDRLLVTGAQSVDSSEPISFYVWDGCKDPAFYFQRPLTDSATWKCTECDFYIQNDYQLYWVEQVPVLETQAGRFEDVVKVRHLYEYGYGAVAWYWLKSGVGIVKRRQMYGSEGAPCGDVDITVTWELVDYEVK